MTHDEKVTLLKIALGFQMQVNERAIDLIVRMTDCLNVKGGQMDLADISKIIVANEQRYQAQPDTSVHQMD